MRDVRVNQVIDDNTCGVCKCFLSVFKRNVLVILEIWRYDESLHRPPLDFSEAHATVIHVDLAFLNVLEISLEEWQLVSCLDRELLHLLAEQIVSSQDMEVKVVDDAVSAH